MKADSVAPSSAAARRRFFVTFVVASVLAAITLATIAGVIWWRPAARAERFLVEAQSRLASGDEAGAEQAAVEALRLDGSLAEAALIAAEAAELQGEPQSAVDYAQRAVAIDGARAVFRRRAASLSARLNHRTLRSLADAERDYRTVLSIDPDDVEANTGMAQLLGLCGRWRESIPFVLHVVEQNEPTDLLVLIAREDGVIQEADALEQACQAAPNDPNPYVGLAWHARSEERPDDVAANLELALERAPDHPAANVAWGQALLAAQQYEQLGDWLSRRPAETDRFPETWLIRGVMAERAGDVKGAIRCYWESAKRGPESKNTLSRLARLLGEDGNTEEARRVAEQVERLHELGMIQDRVLLSGGHEGVTPLLELAGHYERVGRLWEAYGWCRLAAFADPYSAPAHRRAELLAPQVKGLPLRRTADEANVAMSLDLSEYPLPKSPEPIERTAEHDASRLSPLSFRDDAGDVGIRFRYFNGTDGTPTRRMYEFTGGGIGVLDYDVDGYPDLYFTQGRTWPPTGGDDRHLDRLYRNRGGARFDDATVAAGVRDSGFGQGIAVGDFDADGFPDAVVANIGGVRLLRNNGDGTLSDETNAAGIEGHGWTTSCLFADVDGDALPDVYAVNYVKGDDVFERICGTAETPRICMPFDFDGEADRLWRNVGDGTVTDATAELLSVEPAGKGLGVVAWNAHGSGRLSLFVANDTTPNFLFEPETDSASTGTPPMQERGIVAGVALNGDGKATGCMGVAVGDVDDDGRFDLYVTNFLAEPSTFYRGISAGFYEDQTRSVDLHASSMNVLGFGTQFFDADLDGLFELFVANGHIDDLRDTGRPYEMPPQLYRWNGRRFQLAANVGLGPYFERQWLGRAVARLDWNRDGRDDLAIGHLANDSALLTNTSPDVGRCLSLRLTGVDSNRDAIGTIVQAKVGGRTLTRQLTAGDGYQASNERRLIFGVGDADRIEELIVTWPSGRVQTFPNVETGYAWLAEGRRLIYADRSVAVKP